MEVADWAPSEAAAAAPAEKASAKEADVPPRPTFQACVSMDVGGGVPSSAYHSCAAIEATEQATRKPQCPSARSSSDDGEDTLAAEPPAAEAATTESSAMPDAEGAGARGGSARGSDDGEACGSAGSDPPCPSGSDDGGERDASPFSRASGFSSGMQCGPNGNQSDKGVTACPQCGEQFTTLFRRHHCRSCGGLVCDNCSRGRQRLPRHPDWGKVRVCEPCFKTIQEDNAAHFEEDLEVKDQVISELREMLSKKFAECEGFKKLLLELDADVSGDHGLLERYRRDPESKDYSFEKLRDKAQTVWSKLLQSLEDENHRNGDLQERRRACLHKLELEGSHQEALMARRAELDVEVAEVNRLEGDRDRLARDEADLHRKCAEMQRTVQELERRRQELLEQNARGRRGTWSSRSFSSGAGMDPAPFTISSGRDPSLVSQSRIEGCRRGCLLM